MSILARLFSKMILFRFFGILTAISVFVIALEIFATLDDLLKKTQGHEYRIFEYAVLLIPETAGTFFLMSLLLAVLLTLLELNGRHELPIVWACGLSPLQVTRFLLPLGLGLGFFHFTLVDQLIPSVAPRLDTWEVGERALKKLGGREGGAVWMRSGSDVIRIARFEAQGTHLFHVMIFRRNGQGLLTETWISPYAELKGEVWTLHDGVVYRTQSLEPEKFSIRSYEGKMRPAISGPRSGDPEVMSLRVLSDFIKHAGYGVRPVYLYETWWHRRIVFFLTPMLMIALCLPLATRFRRGGDAGRLFVIGVSLGFTFSLFDGVSLSMGEMGVVSPWVAGWIPLCVYTLLWGGILLHHETL